MALGKKKLGLLLILLMMVATLIISQHYRGMTRGMFHQMRLATLSESLNLWRCIDYWMETLELMTFDPAKKIFAIPQELVTSRGCTVPFHRGDFEAAISCWQKEIAAEGENEDRLFWLAMSYLRQAEASNCLVQLTATPTNHEHAHEGHGSYCTLPLGRTHNLPESSALAVKTFQRLLDDYDRDNALYRWLLSWSAMTIAAYPEAVPPAYRPPAAFIDRFQGAGRDAMAQRYHELHFVDRAAELGVATLNSGRGAAVEDFDRDGDLDLVTGGGSDWVRYYENVLGANGARSFREHEEANDLRAASQPSVITAADFDNDGWVDVFAARPFESYRLLRNINGRFEDVTAASGLTDLLTSESMRAVTWVSAWGDIDNDGDLDLFLAQWGFRIPFRRGLMSLPRMDSKLLRNDAGRFVDVSHELGVEAVVRDEHYIGATFGDYDRDGDADLFLSSPLRGASFLLRNDGSRFTVSDAYDRSESSFTAAFVDVDHDGRLDLFQGGFADARTSTEMAVFGKNLDLYQSGHSTVLLQRGERFEEDPLLFADALPMGTMGTSFGDLDNDGCYDFYLGTGNPESWFVLPNQMLIGRRDGRRCTGAVDNISMLEGFGTIQKGHGIVFFDFDDDGDQDIYSSLGGMWPADAWPNQFFINESRHENSWIKIRLRGRRSNFYGVGARLKVTAATADDQTLVRTYQMDNRTGFGSAPYLAHIGLLDATKIREIEVFWPASGCTALYSATINELVVLDEDKCLEQKNA